MASLLNMSSGSLLMKGLPYDAEIEYLESSGTQYIDTLIYGSNRHGMKIRYQYHRINVGGGARLTGVRLGGGGDRAFSYIGTDEGTLYYNPHNFLYVSFNYYTYKGSPIDSNIHVAEVNSAGDCKLYYDGVYIGNGFSTEFNHNVTTCLFRGYNVRGYTYPATARIYDCQIFLDGVKIRDFIPVRVGQVGYMYDKISGQLFGNSGTGDFILGSDKQ